MEISLIKSGDSLWNDTIMFAEKCSWKAGPFLAEMMWNNSFRDPERVIVAVDAGRIIGYCTFVMKDELHDDCGYSPFIGFIFVDETSRGNRVSEKMIAAASEYAKSVGYEKIYILSGEQGLYEKYGFEKLGDFQTIYGSTDQLFEKAL